jgi:hypothetical protein
MLAHKLDRLREAVRRQQVVAADALTPADTNVVLRPPTLSDLLVSAEATVATQDAAVWIRVSGTNSGYG